MPQKLNYFIWDIYLSNISKKSYSQYGEDLIICSYFQRHFVDKQGNYLNIDGYALLFISGGSIGYIIKVIS